MYPSLPDSGMSTSGSALTAQIEADVSWEGIVLILCPGLECECDCESTGIHVGLRGAIFYAEEGRGLRPKF